MAGESLSSGPLDETSLGSDKEKEDGSIDRTGRIGMGTKKKKKKKERHELHT